MIGVSVPFFVGVAYQLVRCFGDRPLGAAELEGIRAAAAELQRIYLTAPLAPGSPGGPESPDDDEED